MNTLLEGKKNTMNLHDNDNSFSFQNWEVVLNSISDWICIIDTDYCIQQTNQMVTEFIGKHPKDVIGKNCFEAVHGLNIPIDQCPVKEVKKTLQSKEIDLQLPDTRWWRIKVDPLKNTQGQLVAYIHIVRDITEFKKMIAESIINEKLESIGILAGGLAHDYNNLLAIIMGNLSMVMEEIPKYSWLKENVSDAFHACIHARDLTKQLLTFSKGGLPNPKQNSIGDLLDQVKAEILERSNYKCNVNYSDKLYSTAFDRDQLYQAIHHIIENAMEAMPNGGSIQIHAKNELKWKNNKHSSYIKISISDQGVGIHADQLPHIFDPYFSTKQRGKQKGMGMGLSIAYSIVKKHGGFIETHSTLGLGTEFHIYLPATTDYFIESKKITHAEQTKTQSILFMDDELSIRIISLQLLKRLGYAVALAAKGEEAIEIYKKAFDSGKAFDMVILDFMIKDGMGGAETIKHLKSINPNVKVILSSGFLDDPILDNFQNCGFCAFLKKPYLMRDLQNTLSSIENTP
ncbi:MAG: response regulator [Desulfobacterales bacterium]|nr:response regulator [Desulfobacterales bacterium]